ncbi:MAG: hypothetical protein K0S33_530 [Bacteroidetes bacterium]|jgi:hypothetical protein|nr:hypothetical protein [Bacteroidota bacterium]
MLPPERKILTGPIRIAIALLLIGALFKIQHWLYGDLLMVTAFVAIAILYVFRFSWKNTKKPVDHVKLVFVVCWSFNGVFTIMHFPGKLVFQIITLISFLAILFMGGINYFGNKDEEGSDDEKQDRMQNLSRWIKGLATALILIGAVFKIMHWPYALYFLFAGMTVLVIWFLKDSFTNKDE